MKVAVFGLGYVGVVSAACLVRDGHDVVAASLVGANREYILNHIPHIGRLMLDQPEQLLEHSYVVVVASTEREFAPLLEKLPAGKSVIDLVGAWNTAEGKSTAHMDAYDGIAW